MGPQDQVGIFSASGNVHIPYTSDRKRLQDQLEDLKAGKLELSRPLLHIEVAQSVIESERMTAQIQLADESGRGSRFPLIPLGKSNIQFRISGTVDVAFNLSLKNVQPGRYKLTLLTRAPAASGQSVSFQTNIVVVE